MRSAKHALYLLSAGDKVERSSKWIPVVLINIEDVASKKLELKIFWTLKINEFYLQ